MPWWLRHFYTRLPDQGVLELYYEEEEGKGEGEGKLAVGGWGRLAQGGEEGVRGDMEAWLGGLGGGWR